MLKPTTSTEVFVAKSKRIDSMQLEFEFTAMLPVSGEFTGKVVDDAREAPKLERDNFDYEGRVAQDSRMEQRR